MTREKPSWFNDPSTCRLQGNPDIFCPLAALPDFDHRVPAVREYLASMHEAWLERFAFDGIRMDTVKHVDPGYFKEWIPRMRAKRSDLYLVGELLDENSLDGFGTYLDAGFDGLFNFPLRTGFIDTFARGGGRRLRRGSHGRHFEPVWAIENPIHGQSAG